MKFAVVLGLSLCSLGALANCPQQDVTDPAQVKLAGDKVMIVTHASSNDDGRIGTKFGVDEAVRFAKKNGIPVVYLKDDRPAINYFMEDCKPDYWVYSSGGEVRFDVPPSHVYVAGGHLELCLAVTVNEILLNWAKKPKRDLTVSFFMDGIFSNGKNIEETDPYYRDYMRFMSIVNYSRPAGEHFPKLTLLETMGIILNETRQYEYLTRVLPRYDRTLGPDYKVEIKMSEAVPKVIQRGQSPRPPVLRFDFIDSADNFNYLKNFKPRRNS
jgi:hypothetical protein